MSNLFKLKGVIQNYDWGGNSFIPDLLEIKGEDRPYAEYWMGAHANAPSIISIDDFESPLNTFIENDKLNVLGEEIAASFGRLPFLFKVLDVNDMLSIQVHPSKEEAEKGFAKENELGIPVSAPNRNYKDDNHKPEIMVALSEFWLLHGFLPQKQLEAMLESVPEFHSLKVVLINTGYKGLYKQVMEQSDEERNELLTPLAERILPLYKAGKLAKSSPDYWAAKAIDSYDATNLDRGIYSIYFFNIVKVDKGQAVFQDAGIPHAYLEGQNMELMANSDNVLRGGLTPKHVDVPELLKHVVFKETIPNIMAGELQPDGLERIYKSPAPDFELSQILLTNEFEYTSEAKTGQIYILIEGNAEVSLGERKMSIKRGEAIFLSANGTCKIKTNSKAVIYKASAPVA